MSKRNGRQIWHNRPPTVHISCLYPEILALVFANLDVRGKGRAAQVCSAWREACYRKSVWRGVEARIHLRPCGACPADALEPCELYRALFTSLVKRGIKKIQLLSIQRSVRDVIDLVPNLDSLNMTGCFTLTDQWLTSALTRNIPALTELNLSMCKLLSDSSIDRMAHHLRSLELLDLSGCSNVTNAGLLMLARGLRRLRHLNLRSCRHVSDTGIGHIAGCTPETADTDGLHRLEFLGLQDCQKITDDSLRYAAGKLVRLERVNLSFCSSVTDFALKHLSSMAGLRELNLRSCDNISDTGLGHLGDGPAAGSLRVLDVSFSSDKIGDAGLGHIAAKLVHLECLSLSACSGVTDEGLTRVARSLADLRVLNLGQCAKITDKGLCAVADHLCRLATIDLYGCPRITTVGLERLTQLPSLSALNLGLWQRPQRQSSAYVAVVGHQLSRVNRSFR